jgi:uncharacterized cupredoxin-like copper-binding protein
MPPLKPDREAQKRSYDMRKLNLLTTLAITAALAISCTAAAAPAAVAAKGGTVNATLTDMKVAVDRTTVSAGPVTFVVKNSGAVVHELVLIQTDLSQDKLAMDMDEAGKMDETGNVGETGDMAIGESKSFTVTLPAGHYVLMCNEIGHYSSGMHMAFTVN